MFSALQYKGRHIIEWQSQLVGNDEMANGCTSFIFPCWCEMGTFKFLFFFYVYCSKRYGEELYKCMEIPFIDTINSNSFWKLFFSFRRNEYVLWMTSSQPSIWLELRANRILLSLGGLQSSKVSFIHYENAKISIKIIKS